MITLTNELETRLPVRAWVYIALAVLLGNVLGFWGGYNHAQDEFRQDAVQMLHEDYGVDIKAAKSPDR